MIDYCTILFDERERVFFPLHINSLRHYMPGVFNIKVSVRPEDSGAIALCEKFGVEALLHPVYTQSPGKTVHSLPSFDHANRLDLLMKACTSDWVMLSHMDVIWTGNVMQVKSLMTDEYGILGHYPHGSIAVNRKAYGECHAGFWEYRFRGEYWDDVDAHIKRGDAYARPWVRLVGAVPTAEIVEVVIPAVDVGCMLEMEMQSYAYKHHRGAVTEHHQHICFGSYHGRKSVIDSGESVGHWGEGEPMTEGTIATYKEIAGRIREFTDKYAWLNKEE